MIEYKHIVAHCSLLGCLGRKTRRFVRRFYIFLDALWRDGK